MNAVVHYAILGYCGLLMHTGGMEVGDTRTCNDHAYTASVTKHSWGWEVVILFEGNEVQHWRFSPHP